MDELFGRYDFITIWQGITKGLGGGEFNATQVHLLRNLSSQNATMVMR
jgi:hypothetical protein